MDVTRLTSFADDAASPVIAALIIENGAEGIALHGSLGITRA